jgi:hypothetical protein
MLRDLDQILNKEKYPAFSRIIPDKKNFHPGINQTAFVLKTVSLIKVLPENGNLPLLRG